MPSRPRAVLAAPAVSFAVGVVFAACFNLKAEEPESPPHWTRPPALRPGDTIAFVAPAGPAEVKPLREYANRLEAAGYHVLIPAGIEKRRSGYLAGSDDQRADELNRVIRDPKVRAIFPVCGGFGLTRILDRVDYAALRRDPKIITGYSDLTALHLAIARQVRLVTFHAPMPMSSLSREDTPAFRFAAESFRRAVFADQYRPGGTGYTVAVPPDVKPVRVVPGTARGRLIGGTLSLITATLGTPYALEPRGAILFIEDVHEAPYRVDRMLSQLRLAGVLDSVSGVVAGNFTSDQPSHAAEFDRVLTDYLGRLRVPVIRNFPVGHTPLNATIPHGALAELDADRATLRLVENPVRLGPE